MISANGGPAVLLRNDGGNRNRWLSVKAVGTKSNKDGIGAKVTVTLAGGGKSWGMVKTGSSYCSQSELPLTFGLGRASRVTAIEVTWPNGRVEKVSGVAANQAVTIREGKGIVRTAPFAGGAR